jgi:hypothetical protein
LAVLAWPQPTRPWVIIAAAPDADVQYSVVPRQLAKNQPQPGFSPPTSVKNAPNRVH